MNPRQRIAALLFVACYLSVVAIALVLVPRGPRVIVVEHNRPVPLTRDEHPDAVYLWSIPACDPCMSLRDVIHEGCVWTFEKCEE